MELKSPIDKEKYLKELDKHLEDVIKTATAYIDRAKSEIKLAVETWETMPKTTEKLLQNSIAMWAVDFDSSRYTNGPFSIQETEVRFGEGYSRQQSVNMGQSMTKSVPPDKYRLLVFLLPAPK